MSIFHNLLEVFLFLCHMFQHLMQQLQGRDANQKTGPEVSVQDLAARAASRYMAGTVKSIKTPKTAYDFEVSWRALSDDTAQQIQLLKVYFQLPVFFLLAPLFLCVISCLFVFKQSIPPASLPEIFKNALSAPFLIDIVKCAASIFRYAHLLFVLLPYARLGPWLLYVTVVYILRDAEALAVSILDNLARVPRFDLIIMCLSSMHKSGELNFCHWIPFYFPITFVYLLEWCLLEH
jgi:RNA polymerase II-associated protein 3